MIKKEYIEYLRKLSLVVTKFAMSGAVATAIDYGIYMALVNRVFSPVVSNIISYSIAVVVNFILQKRFVFDLQRSASKAFIMSLAVSLGGLLLSTAIIYGLNTMTFFAERQYITKLVATGLVFFYNFFLKRFVFEKRFFSVD